MRFWINTVSLDHVRAGVAGGYTQADHGKLTRLSRLSLGDLIVFYSPRTELRGGEALQGFTAIGQIIDEVPYQVKMRPDFHPWRRRIEFFASQQAPIRPLIATLSFITDKQHWGYPFRRGLFEIERPDFERIAAAMQASLPGRPES